MLARPLILIRLLKLLQLKHPLVNHRPLLHLVDASNLHDDVDATAAGELPRRLAPFAVLLVADDVVGAEFLQRLDFAGGSGRGNDSCAGGFGKLQSKDAHAASALDKDPLASLDDIVVRSVKGVPGRQRSARQSGRLPSCPG